MNICRMTSISRICIHSEIWFCDWQGTAVKIWTFAGLFIAGLLKLSRLSLEQ